MYYLWKEFCRCPWTRNSRIHPLSISLYTESNILIIYLCVRIGFSLNKLSQVRQIWWYIFRFVLIYPLESRSINCIFHWFNVLMPKVLNMSYVFDREIKKFWTIFPQLFWRIFVLEPFSFFKAVLTLELLDISSFGFI